MKKSTKSRLTEKQIELFPGNTLFDKIARAVCRAGTLPGKELFEAWEVARRVRRKYRGGRILDVTRAALLRAKGYAVITRTIPNEITSKNRLLMAHPKLIDGGGP